jgi:hypothetical protein
MDFFPRTVSALVGFLTRQPVVQKLLLNASAAATNAKEGPPLAELDPVLSRAAFGLFSYTFIFCFVFSAL